MKLSTAIREGAKLRPQHFGNYFFADCSCALGAAYEGATGIYGLSRGSERNRTFKPLFPQIDDIIEHPLGKFPHSDWQLFSVIVDLNDCAEWTREQIADWLEAQGY